MAPQRSAGRKMLLLRREARGRHILMRWDPTRDRRGNCRLAATFFVIKLGGVAHHRPGSVARSRRVGQLPVPVRRRRSDGRRFGSASRNDRTDRSAACSAAAGAGGVGLRGLGVFGRIGATILGDVDQVRGGVVAQQAARAELDVRKTRRVESASTAFAEVDGGLRSEASLAWAVAAYPFGDFVSLQFTVLLDLRRSLLPRT